MDLFDDLLCHGKVCPHAVKIGGSVTNGRFTGRQHILFRATPPDPKDFIYGESNPCCLFKGHSAGDTPVAVDHPIWVKPTDFEPGRFLIDPRP